LDEQIKCLVNRNADVIALQEVLARTAPSFCKAFRELGFAHSISSFDLAPDRACLVRARRYGELIVSRWPIACLPPAEVRVPWPERVLSVWLRVSDTLVEIHSVGIPPGISNGWLKVEMFEGLYQRLATSCPIPRILCGDFNSPQIELPDGTPVTWGQDIGRDGSVSLWTTWKDPQGRSDSGGRWDRAERHLLSGLAEYDLIDVFRLINGFEPQEFSWYWRGRGRTIGRRFDHILASRKLRPRSCHYLHHFRESSLSDHSPIEADFDILPVS